MMMGGCMPLLVISLLALLSIGQAGAEPLQVDDPLIVRAPLDPILFQDKRGFWEDDSHAWLEALLRELSEREALRQPLTVDHPERRNRTALNPAMLRVADQYLWKAARETLRFPGATTDHPALP